ncbi:MAG: hypothetical protein KDK78_01935 [Chlamydiia bacterium]|nr:hypothetical protein [Chlamydiia bacterium]
MRLLRQYAEWGEIAAPDLDIPIQSIAIDSRLVGVGALFCALPGARVDGHAFLAQAAAAGAIASLVDSRYSGPDYGMHLLRCNDTLGTLQHMARQRLRSRRVPVVAVTGSVGKTTTKEFLRSILSVKWDVSATPGNANSQVGLPLYLLNEMEEPELWLLEIGISLPGEMDRLTAIAAPDCALITQVGLVHAATLGSELEIAKEKARIWARPETAMGVAPMDFPRLQEFWESYAIHGRSFSVNHPGADYALNGHRVIH